MQLVKAIGGFECEGAPIAKKKNQILAFCLINFNSIRVPIPHDSSCINFLYRASYYQ